MIKYVQPSFIYNFFEPLFKSKSLIANLLIQYVVRVEVDVLQFVVVGDQNVGAIFLQVYCGIRSVNLLYNCEVQESLANILTSVFEPEQVLVQFLVDKS